MKKINLEVLTYGELKALVGSTKGMEIPKAKELKELREEEILFKRKVEDTDITVLHNGLVLYRRGKYITVFGADQCQTGYSVSKDCRWYIPIVMEGEERIFENQQRMKKKKGLVYQRDEEIEEDENRQAMSAEDQFFMDCERKELRNAIEEIKNTLTKKQREVFELYYEEEMTEKKIAEQLGVTQVAINHFLQGIKKKFYKKRENFSR